MGLPWIELHISLPRHPKSLALGLALSSPMAWAHMAALWLWCGENRPEGTFDGDMAGAMVESAANWMGKPGAFVEAAVRVGFLEKTDTGYAARSWQKRAAVHLAKMERDRARQRERYTTSSAKYGATSQKSPVEKPRRTRGKRLVVAGNSNPNPNPEEEQKQPVGSPPPELVVFGHWKQVMKKNGRTEFDEKRQKAVRARLAGGYSVEDLCRAVDGCALTPHNRGENDKGQRYDDLELICRTAGHVDRFMGNASNPPRARDSAAGRATNADKDWSGVAPSEESEALFEEATG